MSNSNEKTTHVVTHPSLYLRVNGKIQQMNVGDKLTLTGTQAEGLERKGFVEKVSKKGPVEAGRKGPEPKADGK